MMILPIWLKILLSKSVSVLPLLIFNELKQVATDIHYLNVLEIMSKKEMKKIIADQKELISLLRSKLARLRRKL